VKNIQREEYFEVSQSKQSEICQGSITIILDHHIWEGFTKASHKVFRHFEIQIILKC
jgi:hypothetical protein